MADRIFIDRNYKQYIDKWSDEENILDFKDIENIEKFTLFAAMGINNPIPISGPREGFVRLTSIPSGYKAILSSILLGKISDKDIDKYANDEACYEEAEKCVESGFLVFKDKVLNSKGDEDLLCKQLMNELDILFETNVKPNLEVNGGE